MKEIQQALIQEFKSESQRKNITNLVLFVVSELREKGFTQLDTKNIKGIINTGINENITSAYIIGAIGHLSGFFDFKVDYEACYKLAERMISSSDEDCYDLGYLILACLSSMGMGCKKSIDKAKLYIDRIKDKGVILNAVLIMH